MTSPLRAPQPIPPPPTRGFPVVATLAPVLLSVGMWLVTSSPTALLFAALGPVVAVAGLADARLGGRRVRRREEARLARELGALDRGIREAHAAERQSLAQAHPGAHAVLGRAEHDPDRWGTDVGGARLVLGRGRVASTVRVGESDAPGVADLARRASVVADAAVTVPASGGVAIVGEPVRASAAVRAIAVALLAQVPPATHELVVSSDDDPEVWAGLPHPVQRDGGLAVGSVVVRERDDVRGSRGEGPGGFGRELGRGRGPGLPGDQGTSQSATIAAVPLARLAPSACRTVLVLGDEPALVRVDGDAPLGPIAPEYLSRAACVRASARLGELARHDGVLGVAQGLPEFVALDDVLAQAPAGRDRLAAAIGVGVDGPVVLDLVAQGPHAVVGGMTGSGKSELLVAWVLALAAAHPPAELALLLVDFKGGASFAPLEHLPHVVGVLSDLDEAGAQRALASLSAEIRHRERVLAEARVRSIDGLPGGGGGAGTGADAGAGADGGAGSGPGGVAALGRLLIVVDEFQALVAGFPELHAVVGDIAARGRSLGMHLVLCTQRPAGAVRDGVLANASVRVSLRVNNPADSLAVVGTDAAASLPPDIPGRALVSTGGPAELVQVPLAVADDARRVAERWASAPAPRRPWVAPLPAVVPLDEVARRAVRDGSGGGILLGLADEPEHQRQVPVVWRPRDHGPLLVLGAPRSGRSGVLDIVASQRGATVVPADPEAAWDAVQQEAASAPLLLDDVDLALARMPDEHAHAFADRLALLLREAASADRPVALTAASVPPALQSALAGAGERMLLRHPSRQDRVVAGGRGDDHDPEAPPGRGVLRGRVVQAVLAERPAARTAAAIERFVPGRSPLAVVSPRAVAMAEEARIAGVRAALLTGESSEAAVLTASAPRLVLGDPDAWQALWGALPTLAATRPVLLIGCAPVVVRSLLREHALPPLMMPGEGRGLLRHPDGKVTRVRLAPWNPHADVPEQH